MAFRGIGSSPEGIYTNLGGPLMKVINSGDSFDGKTIASFLGLSFSSEGLSGNNVAFYATFTNGSKGLYVATYVPEPSSTTLLLIGTAAVAAGLFAPPPTQRHLAVSTGRDPSL